MYQEIVDAKERAQEIKETIQRKLTTGSHRDQYNYWGGKVSAFSQVLALLDMEMANVTK